MGKFEIISEAIFHGCIARNDKGEPWLEHPDGPIGDGPTLAILACTSANFNVFSPTYTTNSIYAAKFLRVMMRSPTFIFSNKYSVMGADITDELFAAAAARIDLLTSLSASNTTSLSGDAFVDVVLSPKMNLARYFRCWFEFDAKKLPVDVALKKNAEFATALVRVLKAPDCDVNPSVRKCAVQWVTRKLYNPSAGAPPYVNEPAREGILKAGVIPAVCALLSRAALHKMHVECLTLLQRLVRRNKEVTIAMLEPVLEQLTTYALVHPAPEIRWEASWLVDAMNDGRPVEFFEHNSIRGIMAFVVRNSIVASLGDIQYQYSCEDAALLAHLKHPDTQNKKKNGGGDSDDDGGGGGSDSAPHLNRYAAKNVQGLARCISRVFGCAARNRSPDLCRFLVHDCKVFEALSELMRLMPSTEHQNTLEQLDARTTATTWAGKGDLPLVTANERGGSRRDICVSLTLAVTCSMDFFTPAIESGFVDAVIDDCSFFKQQAEMRKIRREARELQKQEDALALAAAGGDGGGGDAAAGESNDDDEKNKKKDEPDDVNDDKGDWPATSYGETIVLFDDMLDSIINQMIQRVQNGGGADGAPPADPNEAVRLRLGAYIVESEKRYSIFCQWMECSLQYLALGLEILVKKVKVRQEAKRQRQQAEKEKKKEEEAVKADDAAANKNSSDEDAEDEEDDDDNDDLLGSDESSWNSYSFQRACRAVSTLLQLSTLNPLAAASITRFENSETMVEIMRRHIKEIATSAVELPPSLLKGTRVDSLLDAALSMIATLNDAGRPVEHMVEASTSSDD